MPERVLVVDDDAEIRGAYEAHLAGAGFEVATAGTMVEAAALLESGGFDALIADVNVTPDARARGLALVAYVRSYLRLHSPVVVVTACGKPEWAEMAARLGVDVFLHKPPSLAWLGDLLRDRICARKTLAADGA